MITLGTPFINKPFVIEPYLDALDNMELPRKDMKLLFLDRSGNDEITTRLRNYIETNKHKWAKTQLVVNKQKEALVDEVRIRDNPDLFYQKRWAVADTISLLHKYREGDMFQIEDDTICPPDSYVKLNKILNWSDDIAAVSGITYSRNRQWIAAVYKFLEHRVFPLGDMCSEFTTVPVCIPEKPFGIEPVGTVGTGCIIFREKYLKNYRFVGVGYIASGQDINVGYYLTMVLHKHLMVDWSVKTTHLSKKGQGKLESIGTYLIEQEELCES